MLHWLRAWVSAIIPLTSFNQMFLTWAADDNEVQEGATLSDSDDSEGDESRENTTEEGYDR